MHAVEALRALAGVSSSQWGMVTTAQASARGVSRVQLARLAESEHLERLSHGIYKDAGSPSDDIDDIRAAWLSTDPKRTAEERLNDGDAGVVISGATASYLHQLGDLRPEPYVFSAPIRRQSQRPDIRYKQRALTHDDVTLVNGLPTTTVERTIAELVKENEDLSLVANVLADAMRRNSLRLDRLSEMLAPLAARKGNSKNDGRALLEQLLEIGGVDIATQLDRVSNNPVWKLAAETITESLVHQIVRIQLPNLSELMGLDATIRLARTTTLADFSAVPADAIKMPDFSALSAVKGHVPLAPTTDMPGFVHSFVQSAAASGAFKATQFAPNALSVVQEINQEVAMLRQLGQLPPAEPDKATDE